MKLEKRVRETCGMSGYCGKYSCCFSSFCNSYHHLVLCFLVAVFSKLLSPSWKLMRIRMPARMGKLALPKKKLNSKGIQRKKSLSIIGLFSFPFINRTGKCVATTTLLCIFDLILFKLRLSFLIIIPLDMSTQH